MHDEIWLPFPNGRPVSDVTASFLARRCGRLAARRARVRVLFWNNAAWHLSGEARTWLGERDLAVGKSGQGDRVCAYYDCGQEPRLAIPEEVA